ncbi:MFS transporter [Halosquirtibacter laminarini]|uniref:MFS transporter n=1 Tax=Halosquirtibacter laminarini TaxID=3374600 RepID=A0AC61NDI1_9BACT|nr:MFS transporter [Prolixibacteraceae bacterium]
MNTAQKSLRDKPVARWSALIIVSITMFCGYFFTDVMSPLKPLLEKDLGWTSGDYGWFTSAYGWFNVFFFMLFIGGIILDKVGARITGLLASGIMVIGASLKYYAIANTFPEGATILGHSKQVALAALGFAIFGTGVEIMGITVSKIIVRWFKGYEMALAMGLQVAVARIGTLLAMAAPLRIVDYFHGNIAAPLAFCLVLLIIGFLSYFVYIVMDKKLEASMEKVEDGQESDSEEGFSFKDLKAVFANRGFWYIAILCVLFYSSVFPFLKYATDFFINKFGMAPERAGDLPGLLPLGTLFLTPIFGGIYDKVGKGATIMIIGSILLVLIHGLFAVEGLTNVTLAVILVLLLGVALSLVPSAMWPSVAKIIPEKQLGTAFSMIFWVQNWGLMGVPLLIGVVLEKFCITSAPGAEKVTYNYHIPMLIFMGFGVLSVVFAFLLKNADKKKGYGLELPNMKK